MMAVLLCVSMFLFATLVARAQEGPSLTNCPIYSENYASGSQYETELKALLPSLALNGVRNIDTYYNTSVGRDPNRIYGFSQCMSASTASACGACLNKSLTDMDQLCPKRKTATLRYYRCIIRYSDQNFFSIFDGSLRAYKRTAENTTQPTLFNKQLSSLIGNLSEAAANSSRLAWGRTNYGDSSEIYGLAQCTGDLPPNACSSCLSQSISYIPSCCENSVGAQIYFPTCSIRYESGAFDPLSRLPPPAPPPPASLSSPPNSDANGGGSNKRKTAIIVAVPISVALAAGIIIVLCIYISRRWKKWNKIPVFFPVDGDEEELGGSESLLFDIKTLRAATNNFSDANKLGQGGFGPVYKGILENGQEIAVKRLMTSSSQGMRELRNEVVLVVKLQHRNLVRLLGCCTEDEEKLLVYEYVPNSSLDKFLFETINRAVLDWETRYKIIVGIARGLLYLHEDSRLRVIHRDLKPSNILLDNEMNPKISDFGFARLFRGDETHGNTSRTAGTYGYMSPEYALQGHYSTKSDVYSFGVMVLEIVTGQKNSGFATSESSVDLLSYTWRLWNERRVMELMDQILGKDYHRDEALRCIHLGLLCVQNDRTERPLMSTAVLMLSSHSVTLSIPSAPSFFVRENRIESEPNSVNELTISEFDPR